MTITIKQGELNVAHKAAGATWLIIYSTERCFICSYFDNNLINFQAKKTLWQRQRLERCHKMTWYQRRENIQNKVHVKITEILFYMWDNECGALRRSLTGL